MVAIENNIMHRNTNINKLLVAASGATDTDVGYEGKKTFIEMLLQLKKKHISALYKPKL